MYRQIMYVVGSDLMPSTNDFSPKQTTVMTQDSHNILARLKFNEDIISFKI